MDGSWSNRKKTFTIGGTLGAIASLVTIVSFFTAHSASAPPSSLGQNPAGSLAYPSSAAPSGHQSTTTSSTASSYMSNCEQNISGPSFCQCTLNWFEANVTPSQFAQDLTMLQQWEPTQAGDPPQDMVKATVACTVNGG
jgi:hypothetical protein